MVHETLDHYPFIHRSDPKLVLVTIHFCFVMLVMSCEVTKLYFIVVLTESNQTHLAVKSQIRRTLFYEENSFHYYKLVLPNKELNFTVLSSSS